MDTTRPGKQRGRTHPTSDAPTNMAPVTAGRTPAAVEQTPPSLVDASPAPSSSSQSRRDRLGSAADAESLRELEGVTVLLSAVTVFPLISVPVLEYFTHGTLADRLLAYIPLVTMSVNAFAMLVRAHRLQKFPRDAITTMHALIVALSLPFMILGLGMFTAATGVVALGVLLFASNVDTRLAIKAFLLVSLGHATIVALALLGVVTSTGLGDRTPTLHGDLFLSGLFVLGEYAAAFGLGLLLKRRASSLLAELDSAARTASAREALLREIRGELDRAANRLGPGRFTGHVLGSFVVSDLIGRGGMGEVYEATRIGDGTPAAIKVLQRGMLADPDLVRRFEREARAISMLRTAHVTEVLEIGGPDAPVPYIAMERLRGTDLAGMLRERGTLELSEIVPLVHEVAKGLTAAHDVGLVHRDLKPNNLFHASVEGRELWKILDFGIVMTTSAAEPTLTQDQIVGTPQYMAPEQALGERNLDRRVDVHALAAIVYRALTGRPAWARAEPAVVLVAVATEVPEDPFSFCNLPYDVVLVLRLGLAKRRAERLESAQAFADALDAAARSELDPALRTRARALLAREPWGARVTLPRNEDASLAPP